MKQKIFNIVLPVLLLISVIGNVFLISKINKSNDVSDPSTVLRLQQQVDDFTANLINTQKLLAESGELLNASNEKVAELEARIAELEK